MSGAKPKRSNDLLRNLPSVDEVLRTAAGQDYASSAGITAAASGAREVIEQLRNDLVDSPEPVRDKAGLLKLAEQKLERHSRLEKASGVPWVINATGVIIHTNLGRAPLSEDAIAAVGKAAGYCALEYDLAAGQRGRRGGRVERSIAELSGAEDAVVVNNGAAAAFFVLTAFASGGEVVISRGELVEIGGDFRIPDVLETSGAVLKEVGTTNRTKLADYARAAGPDTRMILRVHPSNFRIVGFTASPTREELSALAKARGLLFYEDLGSGALVDLSDVDLTDEPVVSRAVQAGVDLVSFSGDKLLGGPQAGIVAGRKDLIQQLRKHPLYRVLRPDKLTFAALQGTLLTYRKGEMFEKIPVLRQLAETAASIGERARSIVDAAGSFKELAVEIVDGSSAVGGGAAPAASIPTRLISVTHPEVSAQRLEERLRMEMPVPVIARIDSDQVMLDLRTVPVEDEPLVIEALRHLDR